MHSTSSYAYPTDSHVQISGDSSSNSTAKGRYKNLQKGDSTLEVSKQFFQIKKNNPPKTGLPRSRDQKAVTYDSAPNFAQKKPLSHPYLVFYNKNLSQAARERNAEKATEIFSQIKQD